MVLCAVDNMVLSKTLKSSQEIKSALTPWNLKRWICHQEYNDKYFYAREITNHDRI